MRTKYLLIILLFSSLGSIPGFSYPVQYAEQWYRLYHTHFYQNPENIKENLYYLERALSSDFANPLYALGGPRNSKAEWRKYRSLFYMHVHLEIIKLYRTMARKYDREDAYFYNAPWKNENLESLDAAEYLYKSAGTYWPRAVHYARQADTYSYLHLDGLESWENERFRIIEGELDYSDIINMDLSHLNEVRMKFLEMDETTY